MENFKETNVIALILGGYINSYGLVRTLYGNCKIAVISDESSMVSKSRLVDEFIPHDSKIDTVQELINSYAESRADAKIVLFATADWHLDELCRATLRSNVHWSSHDFDVSYNSKIKQYKLAEDVDVDFPLTFSGSKNEIISKLTPDQDFTCVIKPVSRDNRAISDENYFRAKKFKHLKEAHEFLLTRNHTEQFLLSEVINAHPNNVWSCLCLCEQGEIVSFWTGRKLSQSPWEFGVFASATAEWNSAVYEKAEALIKGGGFTGIVQPEFKYCEASGKYYLMEINFRYMMWHYTGYLAGVNLPLNDIYHSLGLPICGVASNKEQQGRSKTYTYNTLHLVNILKRDFIWSNVKLFFKYVVNPFVVHASFCIRDWKPFFHNLLGRFKK